MRTKGRLGFALGLACGGVVAVVAPAQADCARPFSNPDEVLPFNLRLSRADWSKLRLTDIDNGSCTAQFPYVAGEFRCGDTDPWMKVGLRRKRGDQRGRDTDQKPPIKIDFNHDQFGTKGGAWPAALGKNAYRKLSLNQGQNDEPGGILPALLSETVAWRLLGREHAAAPKASLAQVWIHFTDDNKTEYHGVYLLLEDLDRNALERRFGSAVGRLVKTTRGDCRDEVVFDDGAPNESKARFDAWIRRDPKATPATWKADTDKVIELEDLLRHEAVRDVIYDNHDTPTGSHHSNYLAFDPKTGGKRRYFPWDLDDCFEPYRQFQPPTFPIIPSCSSLGARTRCEPSIQRRYLEIMCQMINGTLALDKVLAEWDRSDKIIRPLLPLEKDLVWKGRDPLAAGTAGTYANEYTRMRAWIQQRIPEVRRQIEAKGFACPTGCPAGASEACSYITCPGKRRCEGGSWTACTPDPGCVLWPQVVVVSSDGGVPVTTPGSTPSDAGARDGASTPTGSVSGGAGGAGAGRSDGSAGASGGGSAGSGAGAGASGSAGASAGGAPGATGSGGAAGSTTKRPSGDATPGSGDTDEPTSDPAPGCACALGVSPARRGAERGGHLGVASALGAACVLFARRRRGRSR
jgi:hypothetical protein